MKNHILLIILIIGAMCSCSEKKASKIAIDNLIENAEQFNGKQIETEGMAVHFCGAEKKKLKLKSESGAIVKVVPANVLVKFNAKYNHKKLKVVGKVECTRVERSFVDKIENEKTLLCHIDYTPCLDKEWVKRKQETGVADSLSAVEVKKLRDEMEESGKSYVTVISIIADEIEVIEG